ncbi:hypothetical protein T484DRAFT_1820607 [Baffinella frigidus]|nr:hypothetical protein T484DRAFT_1820607 [Cryptophyta sp. CCMP2293]
MEYSMPFITWREHASLSDLWWGIEYDRMGYSMPFITWREHASILAHRRHAL